MFINVMKLKSLNKRFADIKSKSTVCWGCGL